MKLAALGRRLGSERWRHDRNGIAAISHARLTSFAGEIADSPGLHRSHR
jgi:hypothetical protein